MSYGKPVKNPFYEQIVRDGIRFRIDRAGRPVKNHRVTNPYYDRIQQEGGVRIRRYRGRPEKDAKNAGPTVVKSVRLPPELWKRFDAQAAREGITRHAALRQSILIWLQS